MFFARLSCKCCVDTLTCCHPDICLHATCCQAVMLTWVMLTCGHVVTLRCREVGACFCNRMGSKAGFLVLACCCVVGFAHVWAHACCDSRSHAFKQQFLAKARHLLVNLRCAVAYLAGSCPAVGHLLALFVVFLRCADFMETVSDVCAYFLPWVGCGAGSCGSLVSSPVFGHA